MNDTTWLTTFEAAQYLNVKPRTLGQHWFEWGLKPSRVGRANRFRKADLDQYLKDHEITTPTPARRAA